MVDGFSNTIWRIGATHYAIHGGNSVHGYNCGAFYVALYHLWFNGSWSLGAVLSLIMLFVVASRTMVPILGLSVLFSIALLLGMVGTLALLIMLFEVGVHI